VSRGLCGPQLSYLLIRTKAAIDRAIAAAKRPMAQRSVASHAFGLYVQEAPASL
jgi:hypothetical protein